MKNKKQKVTEEQPPSTEVVFEIVPQEVAGAITPVERTNIESGFFDHFRMAKEWAERTHGVTDPDKAKELRLEGRKIRLELTEKHKRLKEHSLLIGRAIDGAKNIGLAMIVPVEKELEDIEKAEEIRRAKELEELKQKRLAELAPYMGDDEPSVAHVELISERQFQNMLADRKLLHQAKLERAAKEEAERKAKEEADKLERERIELENARLREQQKQHQQELDRVRKEAEAEAAKKARELEAKLKEERDRKEEALRKQRELEAQEVARKTALEAEENRRKFASDGKKVSDYANSVRALKLELTSPKGAMVQQEILEYAEKFAAWIEKRAGMLRTQDK